MHVRARVHTMEGVSAHDREHVHEIESAHAHIRERESEGMLTLERERMLTR